jgi:hypothetical protein
MTGHRYAFSLVALVLLVSCGGGGGGQSGGGDPGGGGETILPQTTEYVVLAWNDLGMHCLNPTYDTAVVLPPYNTVWAQVIRRGNPPEIVTSGLTVEYRLLNNTYSYGKTHGVSSYGQFWDNCLALFGLTLDRNTGLNLVDPNIHNGLSGTMVAKGNHFEVDGIPLTPVDDSFTWNPYQVVEVTVRDSGSSIIAQTRATVPTSDEMNCAKCHGTNAFIDILTKHDSEEGTNLLNQTPVLCAKCHGSPALGQTGAGTAGKYLSQAMHGFHAELSQPPTCYDCHPGVTTQCSRSSRHTSADGNCVACHGSLSQVGSSIPARIPWVNEPKCSACHTGVAEVDTGTTLYRNAQGHGNLYCAACHGSPHAMIPTNRAQESDHYQANQYQGGAKSIGSCGICHSDSRGEGSSEFAEQHGGTNPEKRTACNVCHTSVSSSTGSWPHAYQWHNSN